jgi:NitT/TauT family transport system permease protein
MSGQGVLRRIRYGWLRFPASIPFLISGMRISAGLGMIGAIVAEFAGANTGLGYIIMQSTYRTDTELLFAAVIAKPLARTRMESRVLTPF